MFKKNALFLPLLKKIGRVLAVSLFAAIVILYIFIGSDLFLIKEVKVLNSELINKISLSRFENKNIFLVKLNALMEKADKIPEIKSIVFTKKLPHKLVLEVEEYTPCALFKEDINLAVSKEGVVFPFRGNIDDTYPLLVYGGQNNKKDLILGDSRIELERAINTYLSIKDVVPVQTIKVISQTEVFFYTKNTKTEIRMNSKKCEQQAYYLTVLMENLPSKNVEYMDFRFGEDIPVKP